jgi:AcrR family transcriptional regulator
VHTQASPLKRKPRGEGASRREEILAAAKRLFLTEGYEHATIRKIAAAVGVTSGALYLYFPDKDAILRAIAEDTFGTLLARLQEVWAANAEPLERLRAGMHAYVQFGLAHPDEYRLTFLSKMMAEAVPGRSATCPPEIEAADRSFEVLLNEARTLIQAGKFRDMEPLAAAEALWACMHGVTALLLDHTDHLETPAEHLAATVIDMAIRGLCRS